MLGVRTGDKGIDKEGKPKPNYEPGVDLLAKITVLGEGPRGSLTKKLVERLGLDEGREPQVYSIGVKELWELPDDRYPAGRVTHTLGFPSDAQTYGGGWIYGMQNRVLNLGYVTGLDYKDPLIDPHAEFQLFKTHPYIAKLLEGGKMIRYGAKTIAAGGYFAMPRTYADGVLLAGDCAGFLNSQRLEGNSLRDQERHAGRGNDLRGASQRATFRKAVERVTSSVVNESWIIPELRKVRNFHAGFKHGRWLGLVNTGLQFFTGGRAWGIFDRDGAHAGHSGNAEAFGIWLSGRQSRTALQRTCGFDGKTDVQ